MIYVYKYCTEQRNKVPTRVAIQSRFPRSEIPSSFPLTSKKKLYITLYTLLKYHNFSRISTIPKKAKAFQYANPHHENCGSHMLENIMFRICLYQRTLSELVCGTATGNKPDAFRKHPINLMCMYMSRPVGL